MSGDAPCLMPFRPLRAKFRYGGDGTIPFVKPPAIISAATPSTCKHKRAAYRFRHTRKNYFRRVARCRGLRFNGAFALGLSHAPS